MFSAARRRPASQPAGWTMYKKHIFETVTFPLQFPFVKWLPRPLSEQNDKKVKNQEFKKTNEFLEILDFSCFLPFCSESGLGSHFTKGKRKGNVTVPKLDFFRSGQAASRGAQYAYLRTSRSDLRIYAYLRHSSPDGMIRIIS